MPPSFSAITATCTHDYKPTYTRIAAIKNVVMFRRSNFRQASKCDIG